MILSQLVVAAELPFLPGTFQVVNLCRSRIPDDKEPAEKARRVDSRTTRANAEAEDAAPTAASCREGSGCGFKVCSILSPK